ncbi:MAG TPA: hypothetical protein DCS93_28790 [Microscillaceae bacterium]|nr:hypothetical protein [Microscillaceae bacterium]
MASFFSSVELLSSFMGFFLSIHFFTFKKQLSYLLLGAFLLVFSYEIAIALLESHDAYSPLLTFGNAFLYIPLLCFYITSINQASFKFTFTKLALLIPWLLDSLFKTYWLITPLPTKPSVIEIFQTYDFITGVLSYKFAIILLMFSFKYLNTHRQDLPQKARLWLKRLVIILLIFNSIWLLEDVANLWSPENKFSLIIPELSSIFTLITVCWIGLNTLRPSLLFEKVNEQNRLVLSQEDKSVTVTSLTSEQKAIYNQLENLLKAKKIFTRSDLTLGSLSQELDVKSKALSSIIYAQTGVHYYDFINKWRVEEFKALVRSGFGQQLSIEGMAKQVGFKSKSTFYAYFKKLEHITPKEYQQQFLQA